MTMMITRGIEWCCHLIEILGVILTSTSDPLIFRIRRMEDSGRVGEVESVLIDVLGFGFSFSLWLQGRTRRTKRRRRRRRRRRRAKKMMKP